MLSASLSRGRGDARGLPAPPPGAASPLAPGNDGGGGERRGRWAHPKPKAAPLSLLPTASTRGCPREHPPLSYSSFSAVPPVQPPCSPARTRAQPPPPPVRGRAQRRGRSRAGARPGLREPRACALRLAGSALSRPTWQPVTARSAASALPWRGRALTWRVFFEIPALACVDWRCSGKKRAVKFPCTC